MKNLFSIFYLAMIIIATPSIVNAQTWDQVGNTVNGGDWFGANNSSDALLVFDHPCSAGFVTLR